MDITPLILLSLNIAVETLPWSLPAVIALICVLLLLCCSGFISGTEAAFYSLNPQEQQELEELSERNEWAKAILEWQGDSERFLATVLVANNAVNVAITILLAYTMGLLVDFSNAPIIGFIINTVLITFLILLFGEIVPKILGTNFSVKFLRTVAFPFRLLMWLLHPVTWLLVKTVGRMGHVVGHDPLTSDDLEKALEMTKNELPEEHELLDRIVDFSDTEASVVMTPRTNIVALPTSAGYIEVKRIVEKSGYSRIPIYEETLDRIAGILYVKDLLACIGEGDGFKWQQLLRPPYFIPESKKIGDLLGDFQRESVHLALVVDEYGGTSGLVTLEDVLEEILGEMQDETDPETKLWQQLGPGEYSFDGQTPLTDVCRVTGVSPRDLEPLQGESDTLGGLILEQLGRFPARGERLELPGIDLEIEAMSKRRIVRVHLRVSSTASPKETEGAHAK